MGTTSVSSNIKRKLPIGAEVIHQAGVHFRVWAPHHKNVKVVFSKDNYYFSEDNLISRVLSYEGNGYFSGLESSANEGTLYYYRVDDTQELYPDPASRYQPEGPIGPSSVINPNSYKWSDQDWKGLSLRGQVIYEMHIGTFTTEGDFTHAGYQLANLADTGITLVEIMPIADFPGSFGWGYDGVDLFAPSHLYGKPDDLRQFVNTAHSKGIGVILDVVYNHLGPVGNCLKRFSKSYFTDRYKNDWGEAINYDGEGSDAVREFFITNAEYWIEEFHLDGLRLDATQQIFDDSQSNIITEITRKAKESGGERKIIVIAENEPQRVKLVYPQDKGGYGLDGLWNDDFHHSAMVALTGHNEAYYSDYLGNPQEFISSIKWGYLYQGQFYKWQKNRRGSPGLDLEPSTFINYIQNHDQVANSGSGLRVQYLTSPGLYRSLTALMLLAPETPMLFQGQEFAASSPFFYFSDVSIDLAESIHRSRLKFLEQFRSLKQPEVQFRIPRPDDPNTFKRSKLNFEERQKHLEVYTMHCDLLRLRRKDSVIHSQRKGGVDGAIVSLQCFILRYFGKDHDDRLVVVNLGRDLHLDPAPEPLLAPPEGKYWQILWSSEDPKYGGTGTPPLETEDNWRIPGQSTIVLMPGAFDIIKEN